MSRLKSFALHQVNGLQRIIGGHVWPSPLDNLKDKYSLGHGIPTGCLGNPKSLPDDVLKVAVHVGYRVIRLCAGLRSGQRSCCRTLCRSPVNLELKKSPTGAGRVESCEQVSGGPASYRIHGSKLEAWRRLLGPHAALCFLCQPRKPRAEYSTRHCNRQTWLAGRSRYCHPTL